MKTDILIIGGGAAGMTAALYAKRSGKSVLILEKEAFGGQIATSPKVENFPSIKEISGLDLANNMFEQICSLGVEFDCDEVTSIKKENDEFIINTLYSTHTAKSVIIASGVKHRHLGVEREDELVGHGVSYCAVCDGSFYKDQDVCVIGDANSALQYALMLSDVCKSVTLCMLFDRFFADNILVERLLEKPNVKVIKEIALQEFIGNPELEALRFQNTKTKENIVIKTNGVFIAIGLVPSNDIYKDLVELDKYGYILSSDTTTKTPGLFVAGDCRTKIVRQVSTAIADGAIAAVNATNYINKKI